MSATHASEGSRLRRAVARVTGFWAFRSLLVGAVCTSVDVGILFLLVRGLHAPTQVGIGVGVFVGSVLSFLGNRRFAFHNHDPHVLRQFLKFEATTLAAIAIEAPLAAFLTDHLGVPLLAAKLGSDVLIFSLGQLVALRYLVFPQPKPNRAAVRPAEDCVVPEP